MNKFTLLLFMSFPLLLFGTNYVSIADGDWNDPNSWSPMGVPQVDASAPWPGDNVTIEHQITFTGDLTTEKKSSFLIENGGLLRVLGTLDVSNNNASTFTVESDSGLECGNLYVSTSSSQINLNGDLSTTNLVYTASQPLLLGGSVTIAGNLSANGGSSIFFVAADTRIGGSTSVAGSVQVFVDGASDIFFGDLMLTGSADIRGINTGGIVDWSNVVLSSSSTTITCVSNACSYSGAHNAPPPPNPINLVDGNRVLPVELLFFEVEANREKAALVWSTITEQDNDYFQLEFSHDGRLFETLVKIDGNGTSNEAQQYQYYDALRPYERTYYRLWQVDFDGTATLLGTRQLNTPKQSTIDIYPNPITVGQTLMIKSLHEQTFTQLISSTGQRWPIIPEHGSIELPTGLSPGLYYLQFEEDNQKGAIPILMIQ